jgi:phosphatidylserine decarboxylase
MSISRRIPLDKCAWPLLAGSAGLSGLALFGPWPLLSAIPAVLTMFIVFYFRDPMKKPAIDPRAFVSPADGVVTGVQLNGQPEAGSPGGPCISIFLAVWIMPDAWTGSHS